MPSDGLCSLCGKRPATGFDGEGRRACDGCRAVGDRSPVGIYLAGPVANAPDGGAGWRQSVLDRYAETPGVAFENPLGKYNVAVEDLRIVDGHADPIDERTVGTADIVESDKARLRAADGVLVGYSDVQSVGTPMEVMWARERLYPVALWIRDGTPIDELSPWYRHHVTAITDDLTGAIGHLRRAAGGGGGSE